MEYKDLYQEAVGDLKTSKAKKAFKTMKMLSSYNTGSKILDVKKGPRLVGKFRKETIGKTLVKEEEIGDEI